PLDDSINPLVRASEGLFGDMRGPLDTPRAASTITQALLRERGIGGVHEFTAYAPGTAANSSYGKLTSPRIRGDNAETFVNGQRISYNRFGVFPSFNGVESLDVVRAPGSAIYGSGFMTGGYVNYVTKRPQFTPQTTLTLRVGTWVPGGGSGSSSWLNGSWQIDTSAPTPSGRSAWRVSYEGKYDKTFFRRAGPGARDDRQDLFLAWTQNPRADGALTLDANLQILWQAAPQLLGVNRPSQELIDHGLYYGGTLPDLGINPDTGAIAGTLPSQTPVRLRRDATLLSAEDFSNATLARAQFIATSRPGASRKFVNRTLTEFVHRRRYHDFEYAEYVEQLTVENRSEWHAQFALGGLAHALIAGGTLRYEERESYTNYFNEYFFQYDLSTPPGPPALGGNDYSHPRNYPSSYWPGYVGPGGRLFFPSSLGSPETGHSRLWNPALFAQDDVQLGDSLALLTGLRLDGFIAEARDLLDEAVGTDWHDKHSSSELSWNASLRYKPRALDERVSLYATYQRAYAVSGHSAGGGLMLKADPSDPTRGVIDASDFSNLSELAELGAKFALRDNALYLGLALFDQRRSEIELGGKRKALKARGAEVELVYQPHARLSSTLNLALTDARFDHSTASESGGTSIYNIYAEGAGPGGLGNGRGFTWDTLPPADYRLPGHSRLVVNASSSYQLKSGFGAGLGASWHSEQPSNLRREYHIPEQLFLDLFFFYRGAKWSANLDVLNALDRKNWTHNGDSFSSNMLIWQELPLRLEGYLKRRF
ncbi:hypothetical protein AXK11_01440, partial [Cephaloticoccus primus]